MRALRAIQLSLRNAHLWCAGNALVSAVLCLWLIPVVGCHRAEEDAAKSSPAIAESSDGDNSALAKSPPKDGLAKTLSASMSMNETPPPPRFLARPSVANTTVVGSRAMELTASLAPSNSVRVPFAPLLQRSNEGTSQAASSLAPMAPMSSSPAPHPVLDPASPSAPLAMELGPPPDQPMDPDAVVSSAPEVAPTPEPEKALPSESPSPASAPSTSDKYDTVSVFYATDRAAVSAESMRPNAMLPLCVAGMAFGCYGLAWVMGRGTRSWFNYLGHFGIFVLILVTSYVAIQWQRAEELKENQRIVYSNHRAPLGHLDLGVCQVTIPKIHKVGAVESPSLLRLEVKHDKEKHVVLDRVDRMQEEEFYTQLNSAITAAEIPEVFVFIHGYNVEFDDAARRTAQLAFDLKYRGTPICYSWPSQGGLLKYTIDETNVVWTVPHLKRFLIDIVNHSGAKAVNLVAHSMGNRALTATLQELSLELGDQSQLFNKVVLAAPDVDAEVFRQMAPGVTRTAKHVTLYASSNDNALIASKRVHGYPRAGESGEHLVIVPGVETIDVSTIDTSLLGHSYYGSSDSILSDLYHLVMQSLPARERRWLEPRSMDGLTYWVFHKRSQIFPDEVPTLARRPQP